MMHDWPPQNPTPGVGFSTTQSSYTLKQGATFVRHGGCPPPPPTPCSPPVRNDSPEPKKQSVANKSVNKDTPQLEKDFPFITHEKVDP